MTAIAMTITGPGGGAGIQADFKTSSASALYDASVMTAIATKNRKTIRNNGITLLITR